MLSQFIYGFPMIGRLSQKFVYCETNNDLGQLKNADGIFAGSEGRLRGRFSHSATEASSEIWDEALEQRDLGWLDGPRMFNNDGSLLGKESSATNVAFRFAALQAGNVRALGDCRRARINEFCQIDTPMSLPSRGRADECVMGVSSAKTDRTFAVADQKAA